ATTGASVTAGPVATTTYTITGTDLNGCVNTTTKQVSVNPLPIITVTPFGTPVVCAGVSTTLNANGALTYAWSPAIGLSAVTGASVVATPMTTTTYTIVGTNGNGCIGTTTKTITVIPTPDTTITPSGINGYINICQDDTVYFSATAGYSNYVWKLYGVPVQTGTNNQLSTFTGGFYTVTITAANGCTVTKTAPMVVTVTQHPLVKIKKTGTSTLDAGANFGSYQWYLGGVMIPGATSRTYTAVAGGSYTVAVTDTSALHCPGVSEPYIFSAVGVNTSLMAEFIKLYPNPTNDIVHIDAPVPVTVIVTAMDGKQVLFSQDVREFNMSLLPDGIYRVVIRDKNGIYLKMDKITKLTR
ncbi:MAG: T9SS type A sorting domain-containing protein, partial [Chitinophagaceae bacterium]